MSIVEEKISDLSPLHKEKLLRYLQKEHRNKEGIIKLQSNDRGVSSSEKRLWFINKLNKKSSAYNILNTVIFYGSLDKDRLKHAFERLIDCHENLRTNYIEKNGTVVRKINKNIKFNFPFNDLTNLNKKKAKQTLKSIKKQQHNIRFNLKSDSLIQARLVKSSQKKWHLFVLIHHIICDAWSIKLMIRDLSLLYNYGVACNNKNQERQYRYYVDWQQKSELTENYKQQRLYWQRELKEVAENRLLESLSKEETKSNKAKYLNYKFSKNTQSLIDRKKETAFTILLSAWFCLLYKYIGELDLMVGISSSRRDKEEFENTIGLFFNMLPIRIKVDAKMTVNQLIDAVKNKQIKAVENDLVSFDTMVEDNVKERNINRSPLFQSILSYWRQNHKQTLNFVKAKAKIKSNTNADAKYDIGIDIKHDTAITLSVEYKKELFSKPFIEAIAKSYEHICVQMLTQDQLSIKSIMALSKKDEAPIRKYQNENVIAHNQISLIESLEKSFNVNNNKPAIISEAGSISYKQLNKKVNRLANYLLSKGVERGDCVAIYCKNTVYAIEAILATLKIAAYYLPLDANYKKERINYCLKDANAKVIVKDHEEKIKGKASLIEINIIKESHQIKLQSISKPNINIQDKDNYYCIYTSGSTGKPKGSLSNHAAITNLVAWYHKLLHKHKVLKGGSTLLVSAMGFDLTQKNIFVSLISGAKIICSEDALYEKESILQSIKKHNVSWINLTPSAFYPLVIDKSNFPKLSSLKLVIFGGEIIDCVKLKAWQKQSKCMLINSYGPSECSDVVAYTEIEKNIGRSVGHIIGRPIDNIELALLDQGENHLPVGAIGEIYIGGQAVGNGYYNRPLLNKTKFVHIRNNEGLFFKSGDYGRYLANGLLEYIGRKDSQIKIRGQRIELGEITQEILTVKGVDDCVVVVIGESASKKICAYYCTKYNQDVEKKIKQRLAKSIPTGHQPNYFIKIENIPLTENGKLDFESLPKPQYKENKKHKEAQTQLELKLLKIFQKVLCVKKISIEEDFFSLGGDSIQVIELVSYARKENISITTRDVFNYPNIKSLAQNAKENTVAQVKTTNIDVKAAFPLLPMQLAFLSEKQTKPSYFNQSIKLNLKHKIDNTFLKNIFKRIINRHVNLRLRFKQDLFFYTQQFQAKNLKEKELCRIISTAEVNVSSKKENRFFQTLANDLDIENGPLIKVGLITKKEAQNIVIVIHHLVVDGISWRQLLLDIDQELSSKKLKRKNTNIIEEKKQYISYVKAVNRTALDGSTIHYEYWHQYLKTAKKVKAISSKRKFYQRDKKNIRLEIKNIHKPLVERICHKNLLMNVEEFVVSVLFITYCEWQKTHSMIFSLESHGRDLYSELADKIVNTLGWFSNIFPVCINTSNHGIERIFKEVKENLRQAKKEGKHLCGLDAYNKGEGIKQLFEKSLKPQILINYLGEFSTNYSNYAIDKSFRLPQMHDKNHTSFALEWLVFFFDGRLSFDINYDALCFDEKDILAFTSILNKNIEVLAKYSEGQNKVLYCPSDLNIKLLSINELEKLLKQLNQADDNLVIETVSPLSSIQKGIFFHEQSKEKGSRIYFQQLALPFDHTINKKQLEKAFNHILKKHPILRSRYTSDIINQPVQIIARYRYKPINIGKKLLIKRSKRQAIKSLLSELRENNFDLLKNDLFNCFLVDVEGENKTKSMVVFNYHHILLDGWSLSIILKDLFYYYTNTKEIVDGQYTNNGFLSHLRTETQEDNNNLKYWKDYLNNIPQKNKIQLDSVNLISSRSKEKGISEKSIRLTENETKRIKKLAAEEGITLSVLLQATWSVLLAHYSGDKQVCFGLTVSGRDNLDDKLIDSTAVYINTLPVIINFNEIDDLSNLLQLIKERLIKHLKHDQQSLYQNQKIVRLIKGNDFADLFDSLLVVENYPVSDALLEYRKDLNLNDIFHYEESNFPIVFTVSDKKQIIIRVTAKNKLFSEAAVERILKHWRMLLIRICRRESFKLNALDIEYIPSYELKTIQSIASFKKDYPIKDSLSQLFDLQVRTNPNNIAIRDEEKTLSYAQLDQLSSAYAWKLRENKINHNNIIALCFDRSINWIIALLAVVKNDATYLPLDPAYPSKQLSYMLQDSGASHLVYDESYKSLFENNKNKNAVVLIRFNNKDQCFADNKKEFTINKNRCINENLAYIMYTSGTTGKGKGVKIHQKAIKRLVINNPQLPINKQDTIAHISNIAFDASTYELWGSLLNGACLQIIRKETLLDVSAFEEALNKGVSQAFITASLFNQFANLKPTIFKTLSYLIVGGEALSAAKIAKVKRYCPQLIIKNGYGPTENTTFTCINNVSNIDASLVNVSVGRPLEYDGVSVVDDDARQLPIGVEGELLISGHGLALSYTKGDSTSYESFIEINDANNGLVQAYRSGDAARVLENGDVEILERRDGQIKINGHRVNLEEIAQNIHQCEGIINVVCKVDREGQRQVIHAFLEIDNNGQKNKTQILNIIKKNLWDNLPYFMQPKRYSVIENMKLSLNSKIDNKRIKSDKPIEVPEKESIGDINLKSLWTRIWKKVLQVSHINSNDNFFELGGDSIISMHMINEANKNGIQINIKTFMANPSIDQLIKVSTLTKTKEKRKAQKIFLSPIQHWFFEQSLPDATHFNQSILLKLNKPISKKSAEGFLDYLLRRHRVLRSSFNLDKRSIKLTSLDEAIKNGRNNVISTNINLNDKNKFSRFHKFNLNKAPLFKIIILKEEEKNYCLFIAHHLICDIVSWHNILRDFDDFLRSKTSQELAYDYLSYIIALNEKEEEASYRKEKKYWQQKSKEIQKQQLANNFFKARALKKAANKHHQYDFSIKQSQSIRVLARAFKLNNEEVFLLIIKQVCAYLSKRKTIAIFREHHARDLNDRTYGESVGWFSAIYPVILYDKSKPNEDIDHIKQAKEHAQSYLMLRKNAKKNRIEAIKKVESHSILFNYLGKLVAQNKCFELVADYLGIDNGTNHSPWAVEISLLDKTTSFQCSIACADENIFIDDHQVSIDTFKKAIDKALDQLSTLYLTKGSVTLADDNNLLMQSKKSNADNSIKSYDLSPMQNGMLYHSKVSADQGVYCEQLVIEFNNKPCLENLNKAWSAVVNKHDSLRTFFVFDKKGRARQGVVKNIGFDIEVVNLSKCGNIEAQLQQFIQADRKRYFDLSTAPLLRFIQINIAQKEYYLFSYHHIVLDGWSLPNLFKEIFEAYEDLQSYNKKSHNKAVEYQDYISYLNTRNKQEENQFWKELFQDYKTPSLLANKLIINKRELTKQKNVMDEEHLVLDNNLSKEIRFFIGYNRTTLNNFIQSVWAIVLHKILGKRNIIFGSTHAARPQKPDMNKVLGLFINTLPVKLDLEPSHSLIEVLNNVEKINQQISKFKYSSLIDIKQAANIDANDELFDTLLVVENYPINRVLKENKFFSYKRLIINEKTNYALTLVVEPNDQINIKFLYDANRVSREHTKFLMSAVRLLIDVFVKGNNKKRINELTVLTQSKAKLANENLALPFATLIDDFDAIAKQSQHKTAIYHNDNNITYQELQLASYYYANQFSKQACLSPTNRLTIILYFDRSIELIGSMLAALRLGAVIIKLARNTPPKRIKSIIKQADTSIVVSHKIDKPFLSSMISDAENSNNIAVVAVVDFKKALKKHNKKKTIKSGNNNNEIAEIIFTSGSTGKPKGVCLSQKAILRTVKNNNYIKTRTTDRIAQLANINFDASIFEIWMPLLNGASLVILDDEKISSIKAFKNELKEKKINIMLLATALLQQYFKEDSKIFDDVDYLFFGGEACHNKTIKSIRNNSRAKHLVHMYGPCENTTYSSYHEVKKKNISHNGNIPIGKAINHSAIYIMNKFGDILPRHVIGEIVVAGAGLANAYLKDIKMTQQKFVDRKLNGKNIRMYKTGDCAYLNENNDVVYLSRIDDQIKIRGQRIELAEISTIIESLSAVQRVIFDFVKKDGAISNIIGYVLYKKTILADEQDKLIEKIKTKVNQSLPIYMHASEYVLIDEIPVTANGKTDFEKLKNKSKKNNKTKAKARTKLEKTVLSIWQEILESESICLEDDFYLLGGHSLSLTRLHNRIEMQFEIDLALSKLSEASTLKAHVAAVKEALKQKEKSDKKEYEELVI